MRVRIVTDVTEEPGPGVRVTEPHDFQTAFRLAGDPSPVERAANTAMQMVTAAVVTAAVIWGWQWLHTSSAAGLGKTPVPVELAVAAGAAAMLVLMMAVSAVGTVRNGWRWVAGWIRRDSLELRGPTTVLDYLATATLADQIRAARRRMPQALHREVDMAVRHALWIYVWRLHQRHAATGDYDRHLDGRSAAVAEGPTAELAACVERYSAEAAAVPRELEALAAALDAHDKLPVLRWEPERWHAVHVICDRIWDLEMRLVRDLDGTTSEFAATTGSPQETASPVRRGETPGSDPVSPT